jgi:hypothetical protein
MSAIEEVAVEDVPAVAIEHDDAPGLYRIRIHGAIQGKLCFSRRGRMPWYCELHFHGIGLYGVGYSVREAIHDALIKGPADAERNLCKTKAMAAEVGSPLALAASHLDPGK